MILALPSGNRGRCQPKPMPISLASAARGKGGWHNGGLSWQTAARMVRLPGDELEEELWHSPTPLCRVRRHSPTPAGLRGDGGSGVDPVPQTRSCSPEHAITGICLVQRRLGHRCPHGRFVQGLHLLSSFEAMAGGCRYGSGLSRSSRKLWQWPWLGAVMTTAPIA